MKFIPISMPSISDLEVKYVTDAVKSTWVSSLGKYIDRFETEFANFCGAKYGVAVSNGTVAIHLALISYGIGEGDEVIVPDLSFIATANAVLHAGATPIFADINADSLCLEPTVLESLITPRTKAIMPVHLYGHPADMKAINKIAKKHNLKVIEDAAEAHGASIDGKKVGSLGDCATFSFYGNKNLTTGEGGMIVTNDRKLYEKSRYLRDHAMSKEKRYWHSEVGYNYRMTNIQAALGCAQLERADRLLGRRKEIYKLYHKYLGDVPSISLNRTLDGYSNSYWLIYIEIENLTEEKREKFMKLLKDNGVDSRPFFYPMSMMPYFKKANNSVTYKRYQQGLNLPSYVDLTETQIEYISKIIKENLKQI